MIQFFEKQEDRTAAVSGVAGISAALAAARLGADVLLIEREFTLGGLATLGLITIYLPICDGKGRQVIYGIGEELLRLSALHGCEYFPEAWLGSGTPAEREETRFEVGFNADLLAAGRDISVTDDMWDITRVIPCCAVTGEAAGTAAAMFDDFRPGSGEIKELQVRFRAGNVRLSLSEI